MSNRMAKNAQPKVKVNGKAISALTLAVLLVLSVLFVGVGVMGRKMDAEGLYKLLPWIPSPSNRFEWREALKPGADFGDTKTYVFEPKAEEGAEITGAQLDEAVRVLSKRMMDAGLSSARIEKHDDGKVAPAHITVTVPASADAAVVAPLLTSKGMFTFTTPDGVDFLDSAHIYNATVGQGQKEEEGWYLQFMFDEEGKKLFAEKTTELVGQTMSLKIDGQTITSPSISEPLTQGAASIPGFSNEQARVFATLMRSGPLPFTMGEAQISDSGSLLGDQVLRNLLLEFVAVFILLALYMVLRNRLSGLIGVWTLILSAAFTWFFLAIAGVGFNTTTVLAAFSAYGLAAFSVFHLLDSMGSQLKSGRAAKLSLKEAYATAGHTSLDILLALLLLSIVLIIADSTSSIGRFMQLFAMGVAVDLVCVHVILRLLMRETIAVFGEKTALYVGKASSKKEAV